jgi:ribosomal protein S25
MSQLKKDIKSCKKSFTIISPYITKAAVYEIIKELPKKEIKLMIVTRPPGPEYVDGSICIDALQELKNKGFIILMLRNLHAKLYVIDEKILYIGSANFTAQGLVIKSHGNVEEMIKVSISKEDLIYLNQRYINQQPQLELTDELLMTVKRGREFFKSKSLEIVTEIYKWSQKHLLPNMEDFPSIFSRYQSTKRYPDNFQFELSKTKGSEIIANKQGVLFKLGGTSDMPDATLIVPLIEVEKLLKGKFMNLKSNSWMFRITFIEGKPYFRITNQRNKVEERIEVRKFELEGKLKSNSIIM